MNVRLHGYLLISYYNPFFSRVKAFDKIAYSMIYYCFIVPHIGTFFVFMISTVVGFISLVLSAFNPLPFAGQTLAVDFLINRPKPLAERSFSLNNRYPNEWVNNVFKDNILLTLSYIDGDVRSAKDINWNAVVKPQTYSLTLNPEEVFAFNENVLNQYAGKSMKTTNAHFNFADGFKSSGYLYGDGVCHLASFIYWAAKDAGLDVLAPTDHDFREIPEVPKEYGVTIYFHPDNPAANAQKNLYVANTFEVPIQFLFTFDGTNLTIQVM